VEGFEHARLAIRPGNKVVKTSGVESAVLFGEAAKRPPPGGLALHAEPEDLRLFEVTLDGHLEAGEIEFRAKAHGDALHLEIVSWARAGDRLSALLYNKLRMAKEIQLNMWSHFCVRAAKLAGGRPRAASPSAPSGCPRPAWRSDADLAANLRRRQPVQPSRNLSRLLVDFGLPLVALPSGRWAGDLCDAV
jgi:hypothetical protein